MKTSVMSHSFFRQISSGELSIDRFISFCADAGVDGIELSAHHVPKDLETECLNTIEKLGLSVSAIDVVCDLVHTDGKKRRDAASQIYLWIDRLSVFGEGIIMLSPGGSKEGVSDEETRELMIEGLKRIVGYGAGRGVRVTVENHGGLANLRGRVTHMLQFVENVPGLELTFDSGNYLLAGEDPVKSFKATAGHIVHVHFKDYQRVPERDEDKPHLHYPEGGSYRPAAIGNGLVPIAEIAGILRNRHYSGFISVEYEGSHPPPAEAVADSIEHVNELLRR